jgi:hypothetical protein
MSDSKDRADKPAAKKADAPAAATEKTGGQTEPPRPAEPLMRGSPQLESLRQKLKKKFH